MNHRRSILCVRPLIKILFPVFLPIQESWPFGCFFQNFGPVLSDFLYLDYKWCTLGNFQCWGVLLFWIIVGRIVLAVGAGGVCFDYRLPLFLSFHIDCNTVTKGRSKQSNNIDLTLVTV